MHLDFRFPLGFSFNFRSNLGYGGRGGGFDQDQDQVGEDQEHFLGRVFLWGAGKCLVREELMIMIY